MTSTIAWLDHDAAAYERSQQLLALFNEKESRDELGVGAIRDSIADRLFPGTSTIQTRLRYMCFIPWLYSEIEERRRPAHAVSAEAREAEVRLMTELARAEKTGVIGSDAGSTLKRLPSSIYWAGMGAWGVRKFPGSQQEYHRGFERLVKRRTERHRRDDGEWQDEEQQDTWYGHLLALKPKDFPNGATFALAPEEAELLVECLRRHQRTSLFAWLALRAATRVERKQYAYPWQHPEYAAFPPEHRAFLHHARLFSFAHMGAALLYNLQLAELRALQLSASQSGESPPEVQQDSYGDAINAWAEDSEFEELAAWSPTAFWPEVAGRGHSIRPETQAFVEHWVRLAVRERAAVTDSPEARTLIRNREQRLKGPQSRFTNPKALEQWGGNAGTRRFSFRWPTAQTFLNDLQEAFHA